MRRVRACALSMIIGVQDDHWHYLDQLVRLKSGKLIKAASGTRAISTTASAPSHTKIPRWRLSGSRRCTRLGSRSCPESERTINRFPAKGILGTRSVREPSDCCACPRSRAGDREASGAQLICLIRWNPESPGSGEAAQVHIDYVRRGLACRNQIAWVRGFARPGLKLEVGSCQCSSR